MVPQAYQQIELVREFGERYREYAQYVLMARAVPDLRDGLKPVHRRIVYAAHDMGLRPGTPHKKSARIVGEVLGKYHPHGDASIYDALARMAQDFSLLHPLIDGQGNFGSIDGDSPAAMRYTEARLAPLAMELMQDIKADTVAWEDNFDGSLKEPIVLPAVFPNLLINGTTGIAVGFSSSIPPHNLGEVCNAMTYVCRNWKRRSRITLNKLMQIIPGPDFPTGGVVFRYRADRKGGKEVRTDAIRAMYEDGDGPGIICQAEMHIETVPGKGQVVVVSAIPYGQQKTTIVERIVREVRDGKITGVTNVVDESDHEGMRLVVYVSRQAEPNEVMEQLVRRTTLRATFSTNFLMLAPVRGDNGANLELKTLGLRDILVHFVLHRLDVIQRRSRWELAHRERRLHIVEGLLKALDQIDEVIDTIKRSRTADTARRNLMRKFKLTEMQATAILDMQLRRLAALERRKLQDEAKELRARIKYLTKLLRSQKMQLDVIVEETSAIKEKYAHPRRTTIVDAAPGENGAVVTVTDLATPENPQVVVVTTAGVSRCDVNAYKDRVKSGTTKRRTTADRIVFRAEPTDKVILVAEDGKAWIGPVAWVPQDAESMTRATVVYGGVMDEGKSLVLGTARGKVKRITMQDIAAQPERLWNAAIGLARGDRVLFAGQAAESDNVVFVKQNRAVQFKTGKVSTQATPTARGVIGVKTAEGDQVIGGGIVSGVRGYYVFVVGGGYIKKIPVKSLPVQGRGGQGVLITAKNRPVCAAAVGKAEKWVDVLDARAEPRCHRQRLAVSTVTTDTKRTRRGRKLTLPEDAEEIVLL